MIRKETDRPPRNVLPDLIIPTLALIFAIYYLTTITDVPWIAQASALVVTGLLLISILAFILRTTIRIQRGSEVISLSETARSFDAQRGVNLKRIILFGSTILYVMLLPWLGFSLATFALIFAGVLVLSSMKAPVRAFLVALTCTAIGYVTFLHIFKTRFPTGAVEDLLKRLL